MSYTPYTFASGAIYQPVLLSAKNLPLKIGGATGDLGTFDLPLGLNRYRFAWGSNAVVGGMTTYLEYGTGFLDHGLVGVFQLPSGGGPASYVTPFAPPTSQGAINNGPGTVFSVGSGQQLYICQTQASTSTVVPTGSFYLCVWPIP